MLWFRDPRPLREMAVRHARERAAQTAYFLEWEYALDEWMAECQRLIEDGADALDC